MPWRGEHRKTELPHILTPVAATVRRASVPPGMVRLPDRDGTMATRYRMRECGYIAGVADELHVYDAMHRTCTHRRPVDIRGVAIDAVPVTNAEFLRFLRASGYRPADARNFLKHWAGDAPPPVLANHPVVNVLRMATAARQPRSGASTRSAHGNVRCQLRSPPAQGRRDRGTRRSGYRPVTRASCRMSSTLPNLRCCRSTASTCAIR
jgi:formylglycine-generating enzyme required for sulfatase activity